MGSVFAVAAALLAFGQPEDPRQVLEDLLEELKPQASRNWPQSVAVRHFSAATIARTSPIAGVCERDLLNIHALSNSEVERHLPAGSPRIRSIWATRTYALIAIEPRSDLSIGEAYAQWDLRCAALGQQFQRIMDIPPPADRFGAWPDAESLWVAGQLVAQLAAEAQSGPRRLLGGCRRASETCPSQDERAAMFRRESVLWGETARICEAPRFCLKIHLRGGPDYYWDAVVDGDLSDPQRPRFTQVRFKRYAAPNLIHD